MPSENILDLCDLFLNPIFAHTKSGRNMKKDSELFSAFGEVNRISSIVSLFVHLAHFFFVASTSRRIFVFLEKVPLFTPVRLLRAPSVKSCNASYFIPSLRDCSISQLMLLSIVISNLEKLMDNLHTLKYL